MHGASRVCEESVSFVVDQVGADDLLSIVTFDNNVKVICPSQTVINKDNLKQVVKSISSGGTTNLSVASSVVIRRF